MLRWQAPLPRNPGGAQAVPTVPSASLLLPALCGTQWEIMPWAVLGASADLQLFSCVALGNSSALSGPLFSSIN